MDIPSKDYFAVDSWSKIGKKPHHGINIPLFSIRTKLSCGIGEYLDLIPLIEWCHSIGFDVIQLLPLNDTGFEPSPYSALSSVALNPIYLSLTDLPYIEQAKELQDKLNELKSYNSFSRLALEPILRKKLALLKLYYRKCHTQFTADEKYQLFIKEQKWLSGYALFKTLKDQFSQIAWWDWPQELHDPSADQLQSLINKYQDEIAFYSFLQYLCYLQLTTVKIHAQKHGIYLKGDIPILINKDSTDVWLHKEWFNLNEVAGAPPDVYTQDGQNWGFPLYRWDKLKASDYSWWKQRLAYASNFYQIYRIDHIIGFFRIWTIPNGCKATQGHFEPPDSQQWIEHGRPILEMMLKECPMLPIGEDLGTVPPEVRTWLRGRGICGTKVMRWERRWEQDGSFIPVSDYIPESLTTVSTHDAETVDEWWQKYPAESNLYCQFKNWPENSPLDFEKKLLILKDSHQSTSFFHINLLQEYLSLYPNLRWPNPEDDRINIPGIISSRNWTYRYRSSIEEITQHQELKNVMKELSS